MTNFAPGQTIRCTVTRSVHREADKKTIVRLMRLDPNVKRALKSAQEHRVQTLLIRSRGKRPWEVREKSSKVVRAVEGATWTMPYFPHIKPDFDAVAKYLSVKAA